MRVKQPESPVSKAIVFLWNHPNRVLCWVIAILALKRNLEFCISPRSLKVLIYFCWLLLAKKVNNGTENGLIKQRLSLISPEMASHLFFNLFIILWYASISVITYWALIMLSSLSTKVDVKNFCWLSVLKQLCHSAFKSFRSGDVWSGHETSSSLVFIA